MKYYGLIDCQYLFSTIGEFRKKKKQIIQKYLTMDLSFKYFYKLYIYSKPLLTKEEKDKVWQEINKKSELFETKEEYKKKRFIIANLYAKWNKEQIVMYRAYFFSKDIPEKRLVEMWEEINEYSVRLIGDEDESSS